MMQDTGTDFIVNNADVVKTLDNQSDPSAVEQRIKFGTRSTTEAFSPSSILSS
jgi:hypothetical protein